MAGYDRGDGDVPELRSDDRLPLRAGRRVALDLRSRALFFAALR